MRKNEKKRKYIKKNSRLTQLSIGFNRTSTGTVSGMVII